jgi:branched-chain amino acid transport system permease protein
VPAARLKGLYLVIATLAAQYILLDFFSRADWFSGGTVPASANPFSILGYTFRGDRQYFYVVLAYLVVSYLLVTNLMRTRDGRALVAIRDHYLTGSIMGTLMGTAFVVLLPESMEWISAGLKGSAIDKALSLNTNITFLREIAIGLIIIAFLMFEPDGLAHRWRQIKTYWKLYPFSH